MCGAHIRWDNKRLGKGAGRVVGFVAWPALALQTYIMCCNVLCFVCKHAFNLAYVSCNSNRLLPCITFHPHPARFFPQTPSPFPPPPTPAGVHGGSQRHRGP